MSDTPPTADYPRPAAHYGSAADLENLSEGYFGLIKVIYLAILVNFLSRAVPENDLTLQLMVSLIGGLAAGLFSYPKNAQIGHGANWSPGRAIGASVFLGLSTAIGLGVIAVIVMLTIAANNMKRYGIKGGFFGVRRADVAPILREMKARERSVAS